MALRERLPRAAWLMIGTAIVLATTGCANLDAVRGFAKASAASADAPQVVADYVNAPDRIKRYEPPDRAAQLDTQLAERRAQSQRLAAAQGVLVGYLTSLGDMAADELPNVSAPVDGFFQQLKTQGAVDDKTATAASSVASEIIRASLNAWRKKETAQLIRETNPHLQAVISGLKDIVEKDFIQSLDIEQEAIEKRFKSWEAAVRNRDPDGAPPVVRLLMAEHVDVVARRRDAATAYAKALEKIGEGHASLAKNVDHLDADELKKELIPTIAELRTLFNAVRALTK